MKTHSTYTIFPLIFLVFIYSILLYLIFSSQRIIDFTPFYTSAKLLLAGRNPYPVQLIISVNLNPPFFIWLFSPLAHFSYHTALIIWSILSLSLGLVAANLAFRHAFSAEVWKKYRLIFYMIYFAFFPVLMDTSIVQIGAFLAFFTMLGYHFYLNNRCYLAGIFWGLIIALKLFPALLFFYVLKQKRKQVFSSMLATFLLACLIPLLIYGPTIYLQYHSMVTRILWFGDSWNASIYGFLFRLLIDTHSSFHNLLPIELLYAGLFLISLFVYLIALGPCYIDGQKNQINHQPFCLTLVMMLLLSPFGWIYYFSILIFPLVLTFVLSFEKKTSPISFLLWTACFFLINFPQAYVINKSMHNFTERITLFSFDFYGLLVLLYILISNRQIKGNNELRINTMLENEKKRRALLAVAILFIFGLIVPLNSLLISLSLTPEDRAKLLTQMEDLNNKEAN